MALKDETEHLGRIWTVGPSVSATMCQRADKAPTKRRRPIGNAAFEFSPYRFGHNAEDFKQGADRSATTLEAPWALAPCLKSSAEWGHFYFALTTAANSGEQRLRFRQ